MKNPLRYLLSFLLSVSLALPLLAIITLPVSADQVTVYLTEDSYMESNPSDGNYGDSVMLHDNNVYYYDSDCHRMIFKIPDQTGGGTVTEVLFKIYYGGYYWDIDPEGEDIKCYRLLESFEEDEVTWDERWDGQEWTSLTGGGYFGASGAQTTQYPSSAGWLTFNITEMADVVWPNDLYVLVKTRYQDKGEDDWEDWYETWFHSAESSQTTKRPHILVTYEEESQEPDVEVEVDSKGGTFVWGEITPQLYDSPWANLRCEVTLNGTSSWNYTSSAQNVTSDNPVTLQVTGLAEETTYQLRANLTYPGGTVYSDSVTFTTLDYQVPTFSSGVTDIGLYSATLWGAYSGNGDSKTVDIRMRYREEFEGSWTYTSWKSSSSASDNKTWELTGLASYKEYDYQAQFEIDGDYFLTTLDTFGLSDEAEVECTVNSTDVDEIVLDLTYDCNDSSWGIIYTQVKIDEPGANWQSSTTYNVSGSGSQSFTHSGLQAYSKYFYRGVIEDDSGGYTMTYEYAFTWTSSIGTPPTIGEITADNHSYNAIKLTADITLNDAIGYDCSLYFMMYEGLCGRTMEQGGWSATSSVEVTDGGVNELIIYVDDGFSWSTTYSYYAVLDYTVGEAYSEEDCIFTGPEPFVVETWDPLEVGDSYATLQGYIQTGDITDTYVHFVWWPADSTNKQHTQDVHVTESGLHQWELDGLVYGVQYNYQFYCDFGHTYGDTKSFRCGYWTPGDDDGDGDSSIVIPGITDFWSSIFPHGAPITAIKVIFGILITVAIGGLLMWKIKGLGGIIAGGFAIVGFTLVFAMVNWFPKWVVLLLAVVLAIGIFIAFKQHQSSEA